MSRHATTSTTLYNGLIIAPLRTSWGITQQGSFVAEIIVYVRTMIIILMDM